MGTLLGLQRHGSKADGQTVVGDHLHQPIIHQLKTKLFGDDIYHQKHSAPQKCGRDQTLPKQRNCAP